MKKLPKIITQDEFELLLKKTLKQKKKKHALAMILGFEAGLRISEILGWESIPILTKDRIDLQQHTIKILGKGGKERIVPLPKRVNSNALNYLPLCIPRRSLQYFITKLGKDVLNKEISFHTLRAGFCTHLFNKLRPAHEIQMLMGHSRIDTTGGYARANPKSAVDGARDVF